MVSDPPYGVGYDPAWRNEAGVSATARTGKVANDDRADWREAWALFPGDVAYIWHAGVHARTVIESLEAAGFVVRSQIVWAKPRLVLGRGDYHWQHEPCIYGVRKGATGHWQGARDQTTLWPIGAGDEDMATVHGTQKPVECMRRPMLNNSEPGDAIYEPFCGSGTTIIAAETAERICYAMEIDPGYCDVAIARFEAMTGQPAILDGEDRTFADITAARTINKS
jgi:DNA modification methylase